MADLNTADLEPLLPMPTHAATIPQPFQYTVKVASTRTGKWCGHCAKDNHNDAECWSTRAIPSTSQGVQP